MWSQLKPALLAVTAFTALTGLVYPLAVTALAQVAFRHEANGSRIERDGRVVGSELVGQAFAAPGRFWGRPSATSPAYHGGASSGSNLGPTNPALRDRVAATVAALRAAHGDGPVPVDLATASASGLDPHISPAAARYQVARVARETGLPPAEIERLVAAHTEGRLLGFLGEPRVNVLRLNLALDERIRSGSEASRASS
jgi:K+-transporting ATPase ATPase C chain